ncbi:hypothetical protein Tco_0852433 [Tanacetum coccineum]
MAYFPLLDKLAVAANSKGLFEGMLVYCDRENARDLEFANAKRYKILECLNEDKKQDLIHLLEIRKVILRKYQQVSRKIALIEKIKSL